MIRVVIADDHPLVRVACYRALISSIFMKVRINRINQKYLRCAIST